MEKTIKPMSGYLALLIVIILIIASIYYFTNIDKNNSAIIGAACIIVALFFLRGLKIISPNYALVLTLFGKYVGSAKDNGLFFINPFYTSIRLSLRANNLQGQILKVNDKMGNPVEIGAVIVWQVGDTYKALYEVQNYGSYVQTQSEAAVRLLAGSFAYDNLEDEHASITLREGGAQVNEILEKELTERLAPAGIDVREARISHLAYAPEIAGAMLQRQQATAIVAARTKIVEGAVGMVEMALNRLSERHIVDLNDEKKATMVSNLLVVLCGERGAQPVMNTGVLS